jgi:predicted nuclease with RNAse H fold
VGVDLAGSESRATGYCLLEVDMRAETQILFKDSEIIQHVQRDLPDIVCVDAPLALPKGRCCLRDDCSCRGRGHLRECDKTLLQMGIKFFPLTLGPMRKLTMRGIRLKKALENLGFKVIESYPGAAQDLMGLPRKKSLEKLKVGLIQRVKGGLREAVTEHELDAVTCALVGRMYLEGNYIALGDPEEVLMILPKPASTP